MDFYRVPLNGRNFEYMTGEDPYLGSQLAPAEIKGIQSQGVWACAKHLVCNDEEENRTNVHIVVDERTLREIYLPPFEASVKVGHAATVMSAYNAIKVYPVKIHARSFDRKVTARAGVLSHADALFVRQGWVPGCSQDQP